MMQMSSPYPPPTTFLSQNQRRPELYRDCRLGKYDIVIWGRSNGEIKIGRIEKLSKVTKARQGDGSNVDQCGDPHFYYVYPKFYPDESVFKIRPLELKICDRYLRVGFIVKEFDTGRIGYVQSIKQLMTVKILNSGLIVRDVEFKDLVDPWKLNLQFKRPVYHDGWIGRIGNPIQRRVYLRFIDRKTRAFSFWINWNELAHILVECGIIKMSTFAFESSGFAFWPGKKYKIPKRMVLNSKYNIQWENELSPGVNDTDGAIIVEIVRTEVLPFSIVWTQRLPGFETPKPSERWSDSDSRDLEFVRPNQISFLGDVRMYRLKPMDVDNVITEDEWKLLLRRRYCLPRVRLSPDVLLQLEEERSKRPLLDSFDEVAVEVIYTRSTAEVAWVDGKISRIDSCKICRVRNEHIEVGSFVEPLALPGIKAFGVIQRVNVVDKLVATMKDSTAVVKWFYFGNDEEPEEQTYETELPIKLIRPHSQFSFKSKLCFNVLVSRSSSHQSFTLGFVVNTYPDGKVRVRCVDGSVRRFWPFEITRLSPEDENKPSVAQQQGGNSSAGEQQPQGTNPSAQPSKSLNSLNWKKVIRQVSARNLHWKPGQGGHLKQRQSVAKL